MEIHASLEQLPQWFPITMVGIFGLIVGSFLNVVIHRMPLGQSVVTPRSKCPNCHAQLRVIDNIPVLSWLLLRGRCRGCKVAISIRYPFVELLNAGLYLLCFFHFAFEPIFPFALLLSSALIALAFIDAEHFILPNKITYPLFVSFLFYRLFESIFITQTSSPVLEGFLGAFVGGGFLWGLGALWKLVRGIEGMGLGDVKLMAGVGMFLGWDLALLSIFIGAFLGSVGGLLLARKDQQDLQMRIPFGVFLAFGSIVAMFAGEWLIDWYLDKVVF
jgi:leader peptidase (prepilin peptidase) / N-methyltransferase